LKLLRSRVAEGKGIPGLILAADERLIVACASGAVEVTEIQPEGGRRMSAADFLRGHDVEKLDRLHC
jgi:methionyl-tRNA formyltransferase